MSRDQVTVPCDDLEASMAYHRRLGLRRGLVDLEPALDPSLPPSTP